MISSRRPSRQQGASLFSLLILAVIVGSLFLLAMRAFPSVNEYLTIRKVVANIMKGSPSSPADIRTAFDRSTSVEYSIKTLSGKDLTITPLGDGFRTSFAYNVEIPVYEPTVFILVKYEGSAKSGGAVGP